MRDGRRSAEPTSGYLSAGNRQKIVQNFQSSFGRWDSRIQANYSYSAKMVKLGMLKCRFCSTEKVMLILAGKNSKRTPVRLRHKIEKASAAKQRKQRKLAKKVWLFDIKRYHLILIRKLIASQTHLEPRMALQD
jgi:hypothetical protein